MVVCTVVYGVACTEVCTVACTVAYTEVTAQDTGANASQLHQWKFLTEPNASSHRNRKCWAVMALLESLNAKLNQPGPCRSTTSCSHLACTRLPPRQWSTELCQENWITQDGNLVCTCLMVRRNSLHCTQLNQRWRLVLRLTIRFASRKW